MLKFGLIIFQMGGCEFQASWLTDKDFRDWIGVSETRHYAFCKLCKKNISLQKMGRSALISHMDSNKHNRILAAIKKTDVYSITKHLKPNTAVSSKPQDSQSGSISEENLEQSQLASTQSNVVQSQGSFNVKPILTAETIWTFRTVSTNSSFSSNSDNSKIFRKLN